MFAISTRWEIYWRTSLINLWNKFFPIKVLLRTVICRTGVVQIGLIPAPPGPLPPGVSVAGISNETRVINPCDWVHEFTPEQRLGQPPWAIKPGMSSFHVRCRWSTLTTIWPRLPSPLLSRAWPGATEGHLIRTWTFIGGQEPRWQVRSGSSVMNQT